MYSELLVSSLNFMSCTSDYMYTPPTLKSVRSDVKQPEGLDLTEIRAVPVSELQIAHADPTGTTWHCRHEAATEMLGINVRMWDTQITLVWPPGIDEQSQTGHGSDPRKGSAKRLRELRDRLITRACALPSRVQHCHDKRV